MWIEKNMTREFQNFRDLRSGLKVKADQEYLLIPAERCSCDRPCSTNHLKVASYEFALVSSMTGKLIRKIKHKIKFCSQC